MSSEGKKKKVVQWPKSQFPKSQGHVIYDSQI